jgi:thiosulfate dehydrogenase
MDSIVGVYEGCACPVGPALACNNDACSAQSILTFEATACESYLLRVAGLFGEQSAGMMEIACDPAPILTDCDGNNVEDIDDIRCGTHNDGNSNLIPDICETDGDYLRGGRLYDNWWAEAALAEPSGDHPLWEFRPDLQSNPATGSATWRCAECHGWDYRGVDGQYGTGPHRTGFPGILGTTLAADDIFNLLKDSPEIPQPNGRLAHDYGSVLSDTRISDLVAFVLAGAIDDAPYIDSATGIFLGNPVQGEQNYNGGTQPSCTVCHGSIGTNINFGTPADPEYVGTIANDDPWAMLHKVRFAEPAAPMPSWLANGGSDAGAADIGRYAQLNFPTDCTTDAHCDDGVACTADSCDSDGSCLHIPDNDVCVDDGLFCTGNETCDVLVGCGGLGNPCTVPAACDEQNQSCGCLQPVVSAPGPRYLAISPQPPGSQIPMALVVTQACGGSPRYVGPPFGPHNVAMLVDNPANAAYLTPAQWGTTVYLTGLEIAPAHGYLVHADCGIPAQPVPTADVAVSTHVWGDVTGLTSSEPDGVANARDIASVVDGVKMTPGALPLYTLDLFGCVPNQRLDAIDIAGAVDAVKGLSFHAGALCPDPCD